MAKFSSIILPYSSGYPPTCCWGGIHLFDIPPFKEISNSTTAFYRIHPRLKKPLYSAKADKKYGEDHQREADKIIPNFVPQKGNKICPEGVARQNPHRILSACKVIQDFSPRNFVRPQNLFIRLHLIKGRRMNQQNRTNSMGVCPCGLSLSLKANFSIEKYRIIQAGLLLKIKE